MRKLIKQMKVKYVFLLGKNIVFLVKNMVLLVKNLVLLVKKYFINSNYSLIS